MPGQNRYAKFDIEDNAGDGTDSTRSDSEELQEPAVCHACAASLPADAEFCPKCGERRRKAGFLGSKRCAYGMCCCCFSCCGISAIVLGIIIAVVAWNMNAFLKIGVEKVGGAMLGVDVTLAAVDVQPVAARVSLTDMVVNNPTDFKGNFLELGKFVFDLSPVTVLWGWLSSFAQPIEIEEVSVNTLNVVIDVNPLPIGDSNAKQIVNHMNKVTGQLVDNGVPTPPPLNTEEGMNNGIKAMQAKIKADRIEFSNITVKTTIEPFATVGYTLERILVTDVGKKNNGVYVYQLVEIMVNAILMAVVKGAPTKSRMFLASVFGQELGKGLDFSTLHFDMGKGLEEIGEWTGWVTAEAAMLPLKMAETGTSITSKMISAGTKANLAAAKIGTALTTKATEAEVKAGTKAVETLTHLGTGFAKGLTDAFR